MKTYLIPSLGITQQFNDKHSNGPINENLTLYLIEAIDLILTYSKLITSGGSLTNAEKESLELFIIDANVASKRVEVFLPHLTISRLDYITHNACKVIFGLKTKLKLLGVFSLNNI